MAEKITSTINSWMFGRRERPLTQDPKVDYKQYPDEQRRLALLRKETDRLREEKMLAKSLGEVWDE